DEARALAQAGAGSMVDIDQEHIIAVDSLLTIVNPNNPMNSISISDLARIYSGDVTNWAQLGGENLPIDVFTRPESSGTRGVFYGRVFGGNFDTGNAVILDSNAEMAEAILQNSNAIGFVGYAFLNGAKALNIISECGIETSPTAFGAKTEEYALQRRLYLYTREDMANETASQFIEFATSHAADGVVEKAGYISLGIELISQEIIRARIESDIETSTSVFEQGVMRELLVELFQWDRLSTTFRFASGSNNLERKSQLDLVRLVEHLRDLPAGTGVALVGFTDSDGAFAANRTLSERRADEAVDAVLAYAEGQVDHIDFTTFGFGELASAACNTSNEGKHVNRRVEVWIRGGA
ncbi:MAG: substrate-binding domain-containing protein, partial [Rhodobacteraceae bacterium]|nr:substrate-binding domain-containing protein [Paracoccaceae bacterium]